MRETPDRAERAQELQRESIRHYEMRLYYSTSTSLVVSTENRETEMADRAERCLPPFLLIVLSCIMYGILNGLLNLILTSSTGV